ncbi:MAG: translocation/assembly module TamB, partial [Bacteroidales bacterium]|nr:translocation/assembly module TamB [Bacteroidales bacterium]
AIKYFDKQLYVNKVSFNEPFVNITVDSLGNSNYEYILNKFLSKDEDTTETESFDVFCDKIEIINARFKYRDCRFPNDLKEFNPSDISITEFNLLVNDIKYFNDSISLDLDDVNFNEKSGINLTKFSTKLLYCNSGVFLKDFIIKTRYSEFKSTEISVEGIEEDYLSDPLNKMKVKILIDTLVFDVADLGPFMPEYRYLHDKIYLSGDFSGKLSKFKFKNFNISYGNDTRLITNLSVDGLPDYDMTFIFGDVSKLTTSTADLRKMMRIFSPKDQIVLPSMIDDLGYLSFTGNITGLFNDLVAYGEFNTGLGSIRTDMAIITDFDNFDVSYNGKLQANKINLGSISGYPDTFGMLSLSSTLNGTLDSVGNFQTQIDCNISELGILDYYYSDIKIKGDVSNSFFNGELYINDPNLQVEFIGKYDYGTDNQEIDFSTDIYANLNKLHITNDSLPSEIRLVVSSDLRGDLLNNPEGNIFISNLSYTSNGQTLKLNQLSLNSYRDEYEQQFLTIRSDYADINLYGIFEYGELGYTIYNMIAGYTPTFINKIEVEESTSDNIANFDIRLKALENLTNVFVPNLSIEGEIFAEGKISGINHELDAIFSIPIIKYDSIYMWGTELNINAYKDSLDLYLTVQEISSKDFPWFENMLFKLDVQNDSVFMDINWDNYDISRNSGNIAISTKFIPIEGQNFPKIENIIHQSEVIVENRIWDIKRTPIIIDSTNIKISNFSLTHENQVLNIDGEVSEDPSKLLRFLISNVDINNFNPYLESTGYHLNGILTGNGRVANIYSNPVFRSTLSIKDFKINDEDFGRFDLSAIWEDNENGLKVDGVNKYMKIRGCYLPEIDSIDVNFTMDNFKLDILQPYLVDYEVSELTGFVDIELKVSGYLSDPDIDGYIDFEKTEFVYDFLKIKANTDDKILITNDAILFNDFKIYDEYKNPGTIQGGVYHNKFSDFRFDLLIMAEKMKLLNTSEKDNSLYYGTAYGTGTVKISGNLDKFGIDVVAKTEPNTVFVLPMTEYYESSSLNYVTFVKKETDSTGMKVMLAPESEMDYYFKMDVEVTPEAEVQIVFDPKVGDVMRGFCSGNLKMEYTSDEEFYMYGELVVIEGDYLFTLENIINKKFHIKPGGTILWSGDPYEAQLDLDAIYYAKAPLIDLMSEIADSSDTYTKPVNVECKMHMSGSLMAPDILFSINIPNATDKVKTLLANLSQDEINKQLLYLLILNKFYSSTASATVGPQLGNTTNAFGVTSAELLSNQLSNWLSQISKDFDIGFNYRPGTDVSGQELEVALSTQILNDRVLINGNVGVGENKSSTSNLIGDIEVQLKVNKSGSFRVKGFTRANDDMQAEFGPYTNGVGIFYTQDFNTFGELFTKLWDAISFKKHRKKSQ